MMTIVDALLTRYLAADSWDTCQEILESHPDLLSDEALTLLDQEIESSQDDPELSGRLAEEQRFLSECRRIGVEGAFCERMIGACERDLAEVSFESDPETWLGLTLQVASCYAARAMGDRRENVELALASYERALERMPREEMAESWAATENNLALLYTERIAGRREENLEKALAIYREILAWESAEVSPGIRARVLSNFGKALCERPRGDRLRNLAEAAARFAEAVEIYAREEMWEDWAEVLTNLGTIQLEPPAGGLDDLNRAIEAFRSALSVLSFEAHPQAWARAMINLANAHRERSRSGGARDVEVAIRLYRRVLRKLPRGRFPGEWGIAQLNLAAAWIERTAGERGESLEQAIEACESGLAVVRREDFPDLWAQLQSNLGTALDHRVRGLRAENQERAISALTRALGVQSRAANPLAWAETMHQLANVYRERIRGSRPKNLEVAIRMYRKALEVRTRESLPYEWTATRADLSAALLQRVDGDRNDNLEEAIAGLQEVLEVLDRRDRPLEWSNAMVDLAVAHLRRSEGDRARNVEEAIVACRQALEVQTREAMPFDWARLMSSLALLLGERVRGNRAENLEEAVVVSRRALEVLSPEATPNEWADTLNNLGLIYLHRQRGGRAENVEAAISCFQQALTVRSREASPLLWGMTLSNLASAWFLHPEGNVTANLESSIAASEEALGALTRDKAPREWSGVQSNLANAYLFRARGDREENLERALDACRQALQVRTRRSMPFEWIGTLNILGMVYALRTRGDRVENRRLAEETLREALGVVTAESLPADYRRLQRNLGNIYFAEGSWGEAAEAYGEALRAAELLVQSGVTPEGRDYELADNQDVAPRAAWCLAKLGELWPAVELLEKWKTRALAEALARNEALLGRLPAALQEAFRDKVERIRALEAEIRDAGLAGAREFPEVAANLRAARERLARIAEEVRSVEPDFLPEGLNVAGIRSLVRTLDRPLVYLITTAAGSLALILRVERKEGAVREVIEPVWADGFREEDLDLLIRGKPGGASDARELLRSRLDGLWRLGEGLTGRVAARLRECGAGGAVLLAGGRLQLLPLHAAPYQVEGRSLCLLDEIDVSQAPSARALGYALARAAEIRPEGDLLAVGNPLPLPEGLNALEFAAFEAAAVAMGFARRSRLLTGEEAARREVALSLWTAGHLHLACHGLFDPRHPLDARLVLGGGEGLTVRDLLDGQPLAEAGRPAARLAVLSACESAAIEPERLPDESIGLPSVFLQAGVPGVVGSLWQVDDLSTSLLMVRFYGWYLRGDPAVGEGPVPPARALRRAQLWLRDATKEELLEMLEGLRHEARPPAMSLGTIAGAKARLLLEDPGARPFADLRYWAPFLFLGV